MKSYCVIEWSNYVVEKTVRRAGRAWYISQGRCEGSPDPSEVSSPGKLSVFSNHQLEHPECHLSWFGDASFTIYATLAHYYRMFADHFPNGMILLDLRIIPLLERFCWV
jgi:hypothetical protein